jgi:hypothetical protein
MKRRGHFTCGFYSPKKMASTDLKARLTTVGSARLPSLEGWSSSKGATSSWKLLSFVH